MSSVSAGREDALTLFTAWREDRALIRVELRFRILAATFSARVTDVSDSRLALMSDDCSSELVLPLPESVEFRYTDLREFPAEAREFVRMLVMFYPYVVDPEESDQIVLAEMNV